MKKISEEQLDLVSGGSTISGTVINAFTNIIKVLHDAGHSFGSAVRRITENNLCPLE